MQFTTAFVAAIMAVTASAIPTEKRLLTLKALTAPTPDAPYTLATFNVLWYNIKSPLLSEQTFGNYGVCYNLGADSPFAHGTGSIALKKEGSNSAGCWVYPKADCPGTVENVDYKIVTPSGINLYTGKISSFVCDAPA